MAPNYNVAALQIPQFLIVTVKDAHVELTGVPVQIPVLSIVPTI
jgi:hypothetical protein